VLATGRIELDGRSGTDGSDGLVRAAKPVFPARSPGAARGVVSHQAWIPSSVEIDGMQCLHEQLVGISLFEEQHRQSLIVLGLSFFFRR
jgi:hypothetical protein